VPSVTGSHAAAVSLHFATAPGHDTINLGSGNDTVFEEGRASVLGSVGATVAGSIHQILQSATLIGSAAATDFIHSSTAKSLGLDSAAGGLGADSIVASTGKSVFEYLGSGAGSSQVLTNFIAGRDHVLIDGYSLSYLQKPGEITSHGGSTYINIDGGKTTIQLQGVDRLKPTDFTPHKS
jgi:hypothetical protein